MTGTWLGSVSRRDPSVSLTLAAIVRGAGPHGALSLTELLIAYRETFLVTYRDLSRGNDLDLSEDEIREHLAGSLLPRLATEGWIDDTAAIGWDAIQAVGEWWPSAAADRPAGETHPRPRSLAAGSTATPSQPSASQTRRRITAEFSPMPAVNTSASIPPSAAASEPISRTMR